jgi:hypothetical protein
LPAFVGPSNRNYSQVSVGRQAAIEPNFVFAGLFARLRRAEVEEVEVDGLLALVHIIAGQKDPGDVGLHEIHFGRPVRVERRIAERR